jgi:hypothetical protein
VVSSWWRRIPQKGPPLFFFVLTFCNFRKNLRERKTFRGFVAATSPKIGLPEVGQTSRLKPGGLFLMPGRIQNFFLYAD